MTLNEIINRLPEEGKAIGMDVTIQQERDSVDNWLDHALEKLSYEKCDEGDWYASGLAKAAQVMAIAMSLDGVDWVTIRNALEALQNYLP